MKLSNPFDRSQTTSGQPNRQDSAFPLNSAIRSRQPLQRGEALSVLHAALAAGEVRFARQTALVWLTAYSGDLPVGFLHAKALMQGEHSGVSGFKQAVPILENICRTDPEFLDAQEALRTARRRAGLQDSPENTGTIQVLGGSMDAKSPPVPWAPLLRQARQALTHAKSVGPGLAERLVHQALVSDPPTPVAGILHLQAAVLSGLPAPSIGSLAEMYHNRWPDCLQFKLFLADSLMDGGASDRAVALLHQAAAQDVTGQVPSRLWGEAHPYRSLWPDQLEAPILSDLPVPAAVAAALGWNRLPSTSDVDDEVSGELEDLILGELPLDVETQQDLLEEILGPDSQKSARFAQPPAGDSGLEEQPLPESLRSVQEELEKVAHHIKKPQLAHIDGRFPVYVVLTNRRGLEDHFGKDGAEQVQAAMRGLVEAVSARKNWTSLLFYADDPISSLGARLSTNQIKPSRPRDPWGMKLALSDLDAALRKQGEMIGAVLIVGGPEVVPFHRLPNPVDDDDPDVPSDNPYSTRDENYFVPEWPVGRLPSGCGRNPDLLLKQLHTLANQHQEMSRRSPWYRDWWLWLVSKIWPVIGREKQGLGYSAAVWRRASASVFRPIGEAHAMLVSPPVYSKNGSKPIQQTPELGAVWETTGSNGHEKAAPLQLRPSKLGYFNLHGLADSFEWYGQSDPFTSSEGPEYPVALRPSDISANHPSDQRTPQVVFTEACYGALVEGRQVEESIALTFLAKGSQAVAGSTCTAYGAVNAPLTAADLLGFSFWTYITEGLPAGEALRRAKIRLAREMHRRQGYLDGEDQKTLISFVLYGDPLAQPVSNNRSSKSVLRPQQAPSNVRLVCDRSEENNSSEPVPNEVVAYVKNIVEQYLPGMDGAQVSMSLEHALCSGEGHSCPSAQLGAKSSPSVPAERKVIRLSKQVKKSSSTHTHYARLTLDPQGKLVKLVVSR